MLDYKAWQNGLQRALGIAKGGRVDYKLHQELQSMAGLQSDLVHSSLKLNKIDFRI